MTKLAESEFIKLLERKASEDRRLLATEIIPSWAKGVGDWLVVNSWRVIVLLASLGYCVVRGVGGIELREWILGLFGGFR